MLEYLSQYYGVSRSKLMWLLFGMEAFGQDRLSEDDKHRLSKVAVDYASLTKQLQEKISSVNKAIGLSEEKTTAQHSKVIRSAQE